MHDPNAGFIRCARLIAQADGLLITAGAGLGVDSGLPDFRGDEARPDILMFGDWGWVESRSEAQHARLNAWRCMVEHLGVIEIGAGTAIPSVRLSGERQGAPLIRINLREAGTTPGKKVCLSLRGSEAMNGSMNALREEGFPRAGKNPHLSLCARTSVLPCSATEKQKPGLPGF